MQDTRIGTGIDYYCYEGTQNTNNKKLRNIVNQ